MTLSLPKSWFLYLLECADGTYYVGVAPNLEERLKKHYAGRGAKYTLETNPVASRAFTA